MDSSKLHLKGQGALGGATDEFDTSISPPNSNKYQWFSKAASAAPKVRIPLWKRTLDVTCILIALPTILPVMTALAVVIKLGSRGPLLFRQERVGYRGRRFILLKFRTMKAGACTNVHHNHVAQLMDSDLPLTKLDSRGDERIIPLGRFIRASGLDELPQLINVLRGEMSLVGPRPCVPREYELFLPWQKERFNTLPGLTGLWQVSGKNRTTFNQMIKLDIDYVRTKSLWVDLAIMFKTLPAVMVEVEGVQGGIQAAPDAAPQRALGARMQRVRVR